MLTEEQKQKNREDYKKKRKKQAIIVWVIMGVIFFLLFFGKYIWGVVGFYIPYSEGERVWTIVKLSKDKKWLLHKTIITDIRAIEIGLETPTPKFEIEIIAELPEEVVA